MIENKFERWTDITDPERCKVGDCPYKSVPGTDSCPRHGANASQQRNDQIILRNFRLNSIWGDEINRLNLSPHAKQLLEEISLCRLLIQNIVNMCRDEYDLALRSSKISDLLAKLKDLQLASARVEKDLNQHLDKAQVEVLVSDIVNTIVKYVEDPDTRDKIAEEIDASLSKSFQEQALRTD